MPLRYMNNDRGLSLVDSNQPESGVQDFFVLNQEPRPFHPVWPEKGRADKRHGPKGK